MPGIEQEKQNIPCHLGLIIDGNRRWAKKRGLLPFMGHKRGFELLKKIGEYILKKGIKVLTVYVFSSENWNRSKNEVSYLMWLLSQALNKKSIDYYCEKGIKLRIIGQKERLSKVLQNRIKKAEKLTKNNKKGILNLAISYGGRPEIIQAIKNIIRKKISADKITDDLISQHLWTAGVPNPDLIIRSGGEQRLSDFLTWQSAYSELYFSKKYWPDFTEKDIDQALEDYSHRQRRFGR